MRRQKSPKKKEAKQEIVEIRAWIGHKETREAEKVQKRKKLGRKVRKPQKLQV